MLRALCSFRTYSISCAPALMGVLVFGAVGCGGGAGRTSDSDSEGTSSDEVFVPDDSSFDDFFDADASSSSDDASDDFIDDFDDFDDFDFFADVDDWSDGAAAHDPGGGDDFPLEDDFDDFDDFLF